MFVLVLLLVAAILGVLGVVLKTALVITLSILLAIAFLSAFAYYWFRWRVRRFQRDVRRRSAHRPLPPGSWL